MRRSYVLFLGGVLALSLIASSPQRLVGDGREYLAQAINFASGHGPALRPRDIDRIQAEMARFDRSLAAWDLRGASVADARRNRDFQHFWFYALLASPGIWIARALHLAPTVAFTALNLLLLGAALWTALPRAGPAGSILLFASPVVWWIDKAHTEVFTFALLTIAFAEWPERPWRAFVAAGAAATQNPPIAAVVLLMCGATAVHERRAFRDRRVIAGAVAGAALSLLHPLYTLARHHTPSLLLTATRSGLPDAASLLAVVWDPAIGLVGSFPLLLVVVAVLLAVRGRQKTDRAASMVAALAAVAFLASFARTTNVHHGGTPGMSRYAIWLIPLAVPLLVQAERSGPAFARRFVWGAAVMSAFISLAAFRPSIPENSREPTRLATFLWTRLPSWNNPLPEVFSETQLHVDDLWVPVATGGCEKVLLARAGAEGRWPIPCFPAPLPPACERRNTLCYANRRGRDYGFAVAPGRETGKVRIDEAWPREAEPHVRRLFDAWDWPSLPITPEALAVAQPAGVTVTAMGGRERFILVLRDIEPGATLRLTPDRRMSGVLVDAFSGRTISAEECGGTCEISLPGGFRILLLAMR